MNFHEHRSISKATNNNQFVDVYIFIGNLKTRKHNERTTNAKKYKISQHLMDEPIFCLLSLYFFNYVRKSTSLNEFQ